MLERRSLGEISRTPHTKFEINNTPLTELVFTRDGFAGGFTILYLKKPPTSVISSTHFTGNISGFNGSLLSQDKKVHKRSHLQSGLLKSGSNFFSSRVCLYQNKYCRVSVLRGDPTDSTFAFTNGDFDELYFVHQGRGSLLTTFGKLDFKKNDYILIPRATAYKFKNCTDAQFFLTEGSPAIEIPLEFKNPHGQLKLEAPYTHRDFKSPGDLLTQSECSEFCNMVTLVNGTFHEHTYSHSPVQTIGWDGAVYPITFSIDDYLPKTSKIHLPPNLHMTFKSSRFVVCSFVPRLVDYGENSVPCPYPHSNAHCDEILYYVSGDFTSRRGIGPGSISHHPAGIPHGPQPGNYLASIGTKSTNELAVMVDTWDPLMQTENSLSIEDEGYMDSWKD